MMTDKVRQLLTQISELEEELHETLVSEQQALYYKIEGSKVKFEEHIRRAQLKLKTNSVRWLLKSNPRHIVTAPVIYSMIIPIVILDLAFTIYQHLCFPLYKVAKVKREAYITIDRKHLGYLNSIERLNCVYCGYGNGVIAYCREIIACTEQFWCPIKHAHKTLDPHRRYAKFADFGDAENYRSTLHEMRESLREEAL